VGEEKMKKIEVSNQQSSLLVPNIVFGTSNLGLMQNYDVGIEQMDYFFSLGGRCFDTARVYSNIGPFKKRPSEEILGEWIEKRNNRRDVIISTKGGHPPFARTRNSRLNQKDLTKDITESLAALKADYIDIYWVHRDDPTMQVGEIIDILNGFIREGKVLTIGASNWSHDRIAEANEYANNRGLFPFSASQIQWSCAILTAENLGDTSLVCMDGDSHI
jgi:aryl-alcohol dehydrogenase-like predicted oxidoreductase